MSRQFDKEPSGMQIGDVVVLGAGSWGTALAIQLARAGGTVRLWGHNAEHVQRLQRDRSNQRYLPGALFPDNLRVCDTLNESLDEARDVLISVPSHAFRQVLIQISPHPCFGTGECSLSWATKGLELSTGLLPHQIANTVLPQSRFTAVVSGPTFATEVGAGLPTAITVAGPEIDYCQALATRLKTRHFIAYTSNDHVGVEIGGAVKNPLAIAAGLSDGLGFGANARIALINRGLRELCRLGEALGAKPETLVGLAGMGDLVLTCTDNQSRNRRLGLALAQGQSVDSAVEQIGQVVEGVGATRAVFVLSQKLGVRMPIVEQLHRILFEGVAVSEAVETLLSRTYNAVLTES